MTTTTTTATTTTETTTTPEYVAVDSAIIAQAADDEKARAVWETIAGWVQADFPDAAGKEVSFERCYSAATDGLGAAAFRARCENKGPTVTVVKSAAGHIFGGANGASWDARGGGNYCYQAAQTDPTHCDPETTQGQYSFLFCVDCAGKPKTPFQIKIDTTVTSDTNPNSQGRMLTSTAIYDKNTYGPTFGGGHDLKISGADTEAGQVFTSYTGLGYTYLCPDEAWTRPGKWVTASSEACRNYLHGGPVKEGPGYFTVADYEVFVLKFE